jgi:thioredoxin 1
MSGNKPVEITDDQFNQEVLNRTGISVVDFWAPTCGTCHQMMPALNAFAEANKSEISVFKMDAQDNPKTAEKYNIRSTPTIIFFKDGEPVEVSVGALSESGLQSKLDALNQKDTA